MLFWGIIIIAVSLAIHHNTQKRAFIRANIEHPTKNRKYRIYPLALKIPYLRNLLDKEVDVDHWAFPGSTDKWQKIWIAMSGVVANFFTAILVLTVLAFLNMPAVLSNQFTVESDRTISSEDFRVIDIAPGSPASETDIPINARPLTIGTELIRDEDHFRELEAHFFKRTVDFVYRHGDEPHSKPISVTKEGETGLTVRNLQVSQYGISAPVVGVATTGQLALHYTSVLWGGYDDVVESNELLTKSHNLGFAYFFFDALVLLHHGAWIGSGHSSEF